MIKVAQKSCSESTTAKVSTDGPDDDSQQGPEHTEARPRADRSSVAGCNDAELEQTAAQSPGKMLQISSRQQTSLREREREREKLHQTEAKPADSEVQSQVSKDGAIQQNGCAQQQAKRKPHSADGTYRNAKFKSVRTAARVQCKREASRIRGAIEADRSANDIAKQVKSHEQGSSV